MAPLVAKKHHIFKLTQIDNAVQMSFFTLETEVDKTVSPLGPFSICSGASDQTSWSSSADSFSNSFLFKAL